tara:strand:+ start:271 stop:471 length:201 start_codon:yes stop_codon:yes gene_type:complete
MKQSDEISDDEAMSCLVLGEQVVSPAWLYEALRPGKSWKCNADQKFWAGEARKLTYAIREKLKENH